ncbi:MAG: hypothetical protein P4L73_13310 [Caulobacteraceae bacterium]|nr:hypothetical protein [Caulobacteraceae bacterium]
MTRAIIAAALCALLAACGTASGPDRVTIQQQLVPVAVACDADPGLRPAFADAPAAIAAAPNIFERAKLYAAGRQQHLDWEARLEASRTGCAAPQGTPPR